jgi:hypothetical protein
MTDLASSLFRKSGVAANALAVLLNRRVATTASLISPAVLGIVHVRERYPSLR